MNVISVHKRRFCAKPRSYLQRGFTLVEVMIALALGGIIMTTVIQVVVSQSTSRELNQAMVSVQEDGRFIMRRMRNDLQHVGRFDVFSPQLDTGQDSIEEAGFVQHHPIILPGDFTLRDSLGSQNSRDDSDVLVVTGQAKRDCRGYLLGYADTAEFPVVNEYFVSDGTLRCRGFDLRVLRGQKAATGHNNHASFSLLSGVERFAVLYGIGNPYNGQIQRYIDASLLDSSPALARSAVVAIRIGLVLRSSQTLAVSNQASFVVLNDTPFTPSQNHLVRQFETTIALRNVRFVMQGG